MIKSFKKFNEGFKVSKSDFIYEVNNIITNLKDLGFVASSSVINYKTYDSLQIEISSFYDDELPFDENKWWYWKDVKDDVEFLVGVLNAKYDIVGIELSFNGDYYQAVSIEKFISGEFKLEDIGYTDDDIITIVRPFIIISLINRI